MKNEIFEDISQKETIVKNISEKLDLLKQIDTLLYTLVKKEKVLAGEKING